MDRRDDILAITGWGVLSSIGTNRAEFKEGFAAERSGLSKLEPRVSPEGPFEQACWVAGFDVQQRLGKKGTRNLDRTTAMVIATAGEALEHRSATDKPEGHRIGTVVGTSTGSIRAIVEYTRESLVQNPPYTVNPATFPNTVINCAAGQTAIWHKNGGVNATLSVGKLSGFAALQYGTSMLRGGYADLLVAGCVEEYCDMLAWGFKRSSVSEEDRIQRPLGEGCAMFAVELAKNVIESRPALAFVLGTELGVYFDPSDSADQKADGVAMCIGEVIRRSGINPAQITAVSRNGCGTAATRDAEDRGIARALGGHKPEHTLTIANQVGDTFSASNGLQVAALLALFERSPKDGDEYALATALGADGHVGCVLLKRGDR